MYGLSIVLMEEPIMVRVSRDLLNCFVQSLLNISCYRPAFDT